MNPIRSFLTVGLALTVHVVSAATQAPVLLFRLENSEAICIETGKNTSSRDCDHFVNSNSLDKGAKQILRQSEALLPVFSQPSERGIYLVVIARTPSRIPQGNAYCGAGYEDHAVLFEYTNKKTSLRDDFLLQSCLNSISLDPGGDDDILKSLFVDQHNHSIRFRWLTDAEDQNHTLTIANGKFLLK
ncbi:hypothetical protein JOD97_000874 [Duganella sp. 1411]|uniref:hypothetical protein n=1 Tax=Duganella sp. 1411 TaxID=2806572 RepID=UPI001AE7DCF2|nr:hypothetical protein [Duganella sp. 1411]MBP1202860.1 hypothetical protein [Duganella sp. 1411]